MALLTTLATTVIPALLPAVTDGIRGAIGRLTGGAGSRPQSVKEAIALMQAETERLKAIAELDKPGAQVSKWVADLRASSRYIATFAAIALWGGVIFSGIEGPALDYTQELARGAFFFLFGDRVYTHLKRGA